MFRYQIIKKLDKKGKNTEEYPYFTINAPSLEEGAYVYCIAFGLNIREVDTTPDTKKKLYWRLAAHCLPEELDREPDLNILNYGTSNVRKAD